MRVSTKVTDEMGSVPPPALMNASRQRVLRTPANEDSIIAAVERERWRRSRGTARELELTQPWLLEVSLDNYLDPHHYSHNAHLVRRRSALYICCTCNYKACKGWSFDTLNHITVMWIAKTKCLRKFFSIFDFLCNKVSHHAQFVCKISTLSIHIQLTIKATQLAGNRGGTVVKALCYKSEGRCFDPSWCHWNFPLT